MSNPTTTNPIYLENKKSGTTNWKITNQDTNNTIAGYAAATSVNKGESLDIKVSLALGGNFKGDKLSQLAKIFALNKLLSTYWQAWVLNL